MKCPGQDTRYWKADAVSEIKCPGCGATVELFKDEGTGKCKHCGAKFANPRVDFGCATYCKYAEKCLGDLDPSLLAQQQAMLKDRVGVAMRKYFQSDFARIEHATRVARYAEQIGRQEKGEMAIVLSAAYLHDIGIKQALAKYQSADADHQEREGPPVAREILKELGAPPDVMAEVCDIVAHHHHPKPQETVNFKCVYDADLIVNLQERHKKEPLAKDALAQIIERECLTVAGREVARQALKDALG